MKNASNPWLPWVETKEPAPETNRGGVLVIIPTAGKDVQRLKRCWDSLKAAARGCSIHPVVVVSPATGANTRNVRRALGSEAEIIPLSGKFNYCRSINEGLRRRSRTDRYALFLNDDVVFQSGGINALKHTLRIEHWACVGPYIRNWHESFGLTPKTEGSVRTNEPVNGCCVLWDLQWLDRIGELDERFGIGWGLDEADMCLRAVRRGARYGRNDAVEIEHIGHATFGDDYTKFEGKAHQLNLKQFRQKYGMDVGPWGQTHQWMPLPGVQVSISAFNAEKWFERCLMSVETALDGYRWVLVIGDDRSEDSTAEIARAHAQKSSADAVIFRSFKTKARNVDYAKNRVLRLGRSYYKKYPAMCLMDADDEMAVGRVRHLLWKARDGGHLAVMGDHLRLAPQYPDEHEKVVSVNHRSQIEDMGFGPWATLFHAKLIPDTGKLFREDPAQTCYGDMDLWIRWHRKGVKIEPCPGEIVHRYYWHPGTVSRPVNETVARQQDRWWEKRRARLLSEPVRELAMSKPYTKC